MANAANTYIGCGDHNVAFDLYRSAILCEVVAMRREGVYVCLANILVRMSSYNKNILTDTFWSIAREGAL